VTSLVKKFVLEICHNSPPEFPFFKGETIILFCKTLFIKEGDEGGGLSEVTDNDNLIQPLFLQYI